jgi:peroxiredoxin
MGNRVGKAAVPFSLMDAAGNVSQLTDFSSFWLLLVFHRHLG